MGKPAASTTICELGNTCTKSVSAIAAADAALVAADTALAAEAFALFNALVADPEAELALAALAL